MRDIPDEIMKEATKLVEAVWLSSSPMTEGVSAIARALMERDKRAAEIVGGIGSVLTDHDALDSGDLLKTIATAILTYGDTDV